MAFFSNKKIHKDVRKKKHIGYAIALAVAVFFVLLNSFQIFDIFELKTLDLRFKVRGPITPHPDVAMVDVSDDAIQQFGPWPFPRHLHAMFIDAATNMGAESIVFDMFFTKPRNPESDRFLGEMVSKTNNVVFGIRFLPFKEKGSLMNFPQSESILNEFALEQPVGPDAPGLTIAGSINDLPLETVVGGALGMGFINTHNDPDGVCRRTPAVIQFNSQYYPQLTLPAIARRFGIKPSKIRIEPGRQIVFPNTGTEKGTKPHIVPLDRNSNIMINWVGGWKDIKHYSYRDIILSYKLMSAGQDPILPLKEIQSLQNKILVVGLVDSKSHDYYPNPFEKEYFLPGLHVNVVNTILSKNFIRESGFVFDALLMIMVSILCSLLIFHCPPKYRFGGIVLYLLLYLVIAQFAFSFFHIWLKVVAPIAVIGISFESIMFYRFMNEFKYKKRLKFAFQKYVTKDVMNQLLESPDHIKPGGEKKVVTIFFSDIRGFTAMSEKHSAQEMVSRLNEYLGLMSTIIFKHHGTIDKFVGDEIMAYFGAPLFPENHELRAVQAAVEMKQKMQELQTGWKKENKHIIRIGIGINTGEVIMGNVGSEQYMDFTLIGDNVNLGARLCSKAEPNEILISHATYQNISRHLEVVNFEEIQVKGKEKPIQVYSILNFVEDPEKERRKYGRRDAKIPIQYKIKDTIDEFKDVVVNISGGGFRMVGEEHIPVGSDLEIQIFLPNRILINNTIASAVASNRNGGKIWETRTKFSKITNQNRDEIIKYVYQNQ